MTTASLPHTIPASTETPAEVCHLVHGCHWDAPFQVTDCGLAMGAEEIARNNDPTCETCEEATECRLCGVDYFTNNLH